jgi:hypothetical protein
MDIDGLEWVELTHAIGRLIDSHAFTKEEFQELIAMLSAEALKLQGIRGSRRFCLECKNKICNPKTNMDCHTCVKGHEHCLSYVRCEEEFYSDLENNEILI